MLSIRERSWPAALPCTLRRRPERRSPRRSVRASINIGGRRPALRFVRLTIMIRLRAPRAPLLSSPFASPLHAGSRHRQRGYTEPRDCNNRLARWFTVINMWHIIYQMLHTRWWQSVINYKWYIHTCPLESVILHASSFLDCKFNKLNKLANTSTWAAIIKK